MKDETKLKLFIWFFIGNATVSLIAPFTFFVFAYVPFFAVFLVASLLGRVSIVYPSLDWMHEKYYSKTFNMKMSRIKPRVSAVMLISILVCLASLLVSILIFDMSF